MLLNKSKFSKILKIINVPCYDNGAKFTDLKKIDQIKALFKNYNCEEGNLFKFFYKDKNSKIIIASHIDCVYSITYTKITKKGIYATLDNSLTNAIIIFCKNKYPKLFENVNILFTGNEEDYSNGAKEFSDRLDNSYFVLNMDVSFGESDKPKFENVISNLDNNFLKYLKSYAKKFVVEYEFSDDDYREFAKKTKNTISYCIPILPLIKSNNWMHDDVGQFVSFKTIKKYVRVLVLTLKKLKKIKRFD